MELFERNDSRTHYCGTLTSNDIGKRVCVLGWAQKQRDLGSLLFNWHLMKIQKRKFSTRLLL